jgi:citrate lyase subunit beta/citryl-CoA lyase
MRSLLFVPVTSVQFVDKAHERGADAIILDLEDSVVAGKKLEARAELAKAIPHVGQNGAKVFVRINSSVEHASEDAAAASCAGAFGIFLPKTRDRAMIVSLASLLDQVEAKNPSASKTKIVPVLEDPNAIFEAREIAAASPRVFALMCGAEDLATAMGADPVPEFLRFPKLLVHFAAKAAGVRSFGLLRTVADYTDLEAVAKAVDEARVLGFDGATCIHPSVVPILNEGFSPPPAEIERARRILVAFEEAQRRGEGVLQFEGKMVDEPVVERARRLLARRHGV